MAGIDRNRIQWQSALLLTGLAVALQIVFQHHAGALWRDELNQYYHACMPIDELLAAVRIRLFPLFSVMVLRLWVFVTAATSDAALRLYGFTVYLLILLAIWFCGRGARNTAPLLPLALIALHPVVLQHGTTIRPYGLSVLLIICLFYSVWQACARLDAHSIAAASLLAVFCVQTLFHNSLLLAALCCAGMLAFGRVQFWRRLLAVLCIAVPSALSLLPYLPAIRQAATWTSLIRVGSDPRLVLRAFYWILLAPGGVVLLLLAILWFLAVVGIRQSPDQSAPLRRFALFAALLGICGWLGFLFRSGIFVQVWHFLPLIAFLGLALDAALPASGRLRNLAQGLAVLIALLTLQPAWRTVHVRLTNADRIADYLQLNADSTDLIVVHPFYMGISFSRYYHGAAQWLTLPQMTDYRLVRYDQIRDKIVQQDPIAAEMQIIRNAVDQGITIWWIGNLPQQGCHPMPTILPPPVGDPQLWRSAPYLFNNWTQVAACAVLNHMAEPERIQLAIDQPVNSAERLLLYRFFVQREPPTTLKKGGLQ